MVDKTLDNLKDLGKAFGLETGGGTAKPGPGGINRGAQAGYRPRIDNTANHSSGPQKAGGGSKPESRAAGSETSGEDYVSMAEDVVKNCLKKEKIEDGKYKFDLTTTKIRGILSLVNELYNKAVKEKDDKLPGGIADKVRYLKVRIVYEAGRDESVKDFVSKAGLIDRLDNIKDSTEKLIEFARYIEALVAFHRFYGGKE